MRGIIENPDSPDYIKDGVNAAMKSARALMIENGENKMSCDWFTYDFIPQAWFLLTDKRGFVEPYHFGLGLRLPYNGHSCIGGRVPVIQANSSGGLYKALNDYFDFLTTPKSDPNRSPALDEYFKIVSHDIEESRRRPAA